MLGSYLSAGIRVELEGDGVRYVLGPRKVGWLRHLGWVPIGIGAAIGITVLSTIFGFVWPLLERGLPWEDPAAPVESWIVLAAAAIGGLIGLSIAFRILRFGLFVVAGHGEVRLAAGRLIAVEHGGPLRKSRKLRASEVRLLRVADAMVGATSARSVAGPTPPGLPPLARLEAQLDSGRLVQLAVGYPGDELELLANDLAERIPSSIALSGGEMIQAPAVERTDRGSRASGPDDPFEVETADEEERAREASSPRRRDQELAGKRPVGSTIELEPTGAGLVVRIPPAGLVRGSHGLFVFGIVWSVMVLFIGGGITVAMIQEGGSGDLGPLGALAMLSVFASIGVGMLWFGARAGTRRTTLEVAPPLLRIATVTLGKAREETLQVRELKAISVGKSGLRVNNRDVLELKLHATTGRARGLLRERRTEELEWLAAVLRSELDLPADPRAPKALGSEEE